MKHDVTLGSVYRLPFAGHGGHHTGAQSTYLPIYLFIYMLFICLSFQDISFSACINVFLTKPPVFLYLFAFLSIFFLASVRVLSFWTMLCLKSVSFLSFSFLVVSLDSACLPGESQAFRCFCLNIYFTFICIQQLLSTLCVKLWNTQNSHVVQCDFQKERTCVYRHSWTNIPTFYIKLVCPHLQS